jgi:hypothetical protein
LASAKPGLLTTRGPLLMASSVYAKYGVLYDAFKKHYGPDGPADILVAYGTSRDINPSLPQAEIDREVEADPVRNRAEYLSEWRSDFENYVPREIVEQCVGDYRELPPRDNVLYQLFLDSASGLENGDSFAIAVGHREDEQIIVDAVREIIPPFSPAVVVNDILRCRCAKPTASTTRFSATLTVAIIRENWCPRLGAFMKLGTSPRARFIVICCRCSTPAALSCRASID